MPTIETCFNCFGTHSSDADKPGKFKIYATHLDPPHPPPPWGGRGDSPSEKNFFAHHAQPLGKNCILY